MKSSILICVTLILSIGVEINHARFNKTVIETFYRTHQRANGLPVCVSATENLAQKCALEKSGIQNIQDIDRDDHARGCCFNWNVLNCWDDLNEQECSIEKYRIWQQAMQAQILQFERDACSNYKYRTGFSTCGTSTVVGSMMLFVVAFLLAKN